ncbi:hypothetical protein BDR07DRAFT_1490186 [Suillus spraguei]|nr:hypothetical protein BDR07DRAFT_1490186 [Suillus spraguei]
MSFISDNQEYHSALSIPAQHIACYMYWDILGSVLPYYGPLLGSSDIMSFVGYTPIRVQPALYPIYCPLSCLEAMKTHITLSAYLQTRSIHASAFEMNQSTDVPIYSLVGTLPSALIDLPARWTRQGHDTRTHIIYDCCISLACLDQIQSMDIQTPNLHISDPPIQSSSHIRSTHPLQSISIRVHI